MNIKTKRIMAREGLILFPFIFILFFDGGLLLFLFLYGFFHWGIRFIIWAIKTLRKK